MQDQQLMLSDNYSNDDRFKTCPCV